MTNFFFDIWKMTILINDKTFKIAIKRVLLLKYYYSLVDGNFDR
jgi:hypothetical protein